MKNQSPTIVASRVPEARAQADLKSWRGMLGLASEIPLLQRFPGGNPQAESSGSVRIGWSDTSIHVFAELKDDHIFTRATRFNEPLYLLGDCLEIFLQAKGEDPYLEFHVAPNNLVFQLLYPSYDDFVKYNQLPTEEFCDRFTIKKPACVTQTWTNPAEQRWSVAASIDLRLLLPSLTTLENSEWRFHFGRYDYPSNGEPPTLSSSSVLTRLDFHLAKEWGTLRFAA